MTKYLRNISVALLMMVCQSVFSGGGTLFNVSATGTPAQVSITLCLNGTGPLSCQYYNVSALTLSILTTIPNHTYSFAGIKINTPGFTPQGCTPISNGYCLFSVSYATPARIFISKNSGYPIGGTISGLTTNGLVLQNNGADNLTVASGATSFQFSTPVAFGGSYNVTVQQQPTGLTCTVGNGSGSYVMANVTNVSITCHAPTAYVTNLSDNTVSICPVNSDGSLGACTTSTGNGTFSYPEGMTINPARTFAYVVNNNTSTISICPVNSDGSLGTCTTSTGNGTFSLPNGISLNSSGTFAYVGNASTSTISICPVNSDGSLGTCTTSSGNGTFNGPNAVVINPAGTFIYVPNFNVSTVSICSVNSDGSLSTCTPSSGNGTFNIPTGISLNSSGTFAYITNSGNNTVSICPVNNNGSLGACTVNADPTFNFSNGFAACLFMSSTTNYGYIPNDSPNNTISICPINPANGTLGSCTVSTGDGTFSDATGVALL